MADSRNPVDLNYRMNQPDVYHDFGGRVPPNAAVAALAGLGQAFLDDAAAKEEQAKKAGELGGVTGFWKEFTAAVEGDKADAALTSASRSGDAMDKFLNADFSTDAGVQAFREDMQPIADAMELSSIERMTRQKQVLAKYVGMYPEKERAFYHEAKAMGMSGFKPELNEQAKKVMQVYQDIQKTAMETGVSVSEYLRTKQAQFQADRQIKQIELEQANGKRETAHLLTLATSRPNADMLGIRNGNVKVNGVDTPNLARIMRANGGAPLTGADAVTVFTQAKSELHMLKLRARKQMSQQVLHLSRDGKLISDKAQEDIMRELEDGYRTFEVMLNSKDPVVVMNALNSYNEGWEKDHAYKIYGPLRRLFPGRSDQEYNAMLWEHHRVIRDLNDGFTEDDQKLMRDWQSTGTPAQKRYADQALGYARLTPSERASIATGWLTKALTDPLYMGSDSPVQDRFGAATAARHYAGEVRNPTTRESPGVQNLLHLLTDNPAHPLAVGFGDDVEAARAFWTTPGPTHDRSRQKMNQRLAVNIANANAFAAANITDINGFSTSPGRLTVDENGYAQWSSVPGAMDAPQLAIMLENINAMLKIYRNGNPGEYARIVAGLKKGQNYLLEKEMGVDPKAEDELAKAERAFGVGSL